MAFISASSITIEAASATAGDRRTASAAIMRRPAAAAAIGDLSTNIGVLPKRFDFPRGDFITASIVRCDLVQNLVQKSAAKNLESVARLRRSVLGVFRGVLTRIVLRAVLQMT